MQPNLLMASLKCVALSDALTSITGIKPDSVLLDKPRVLKAVYGQAEYFFNEVLVEYHGRDDNAMGYVQDVLGWPYNEPNYKEVYKIP